jgi:hypothetical protein
MSVTLNRAWVASTLDEYAKEGRRLRQKLYFKPYPVNNATDAQRYLDETAKYNFIVGLFQDMSCFGWMKEDFEAYLGQQ